MKAYALILALVAATPAMAIEPWHGSNLNAGDFGVEQCTTWKNKHPYPTDCRLAPLPNRFETLIECRERVDWMYRWQDQYPSSETFYSTYECTQLY